MPQIADTPPILDSSGQPANGFIYVSASRAFDSPTGHVTTAKSTVRVKDGVARQNGSPWSVPPTPAGAVIVIEQDLDGDIMRRVAQVPVPDVESMTYSELLYNRGGGEGGTEPYWWDLTDLDNTFPPGAVYGDFGFNSTTGDVWRYDP